MDKSVRRAHSLLHVSRLQHRPADPRVSAMDVVSKLKLSLAEGWLGSRVVIAKFHYTDPTRTRHVLFLWRNSVGSVRVRFAAKKVRVRVRVVEFSF